MSVIADLSSWFLLIVGCALGISGAVGMFRFKDFYQRVHASSITDSLCVFCIALGLIFQAGFSLVAVKLLIILFFLWFTGPIASHALTRAAYQAGLKPVLSKPRASLKENTVNETGDAPSKSS